MEEINFLEILFWIQIPSVPLNLITKENAEIIGRKLWRVIIVKDSRGQTSIDMGFLWLRVGLQIG